MPESLSVVVPHYGDPAPTLRLVESLRQQTGDHDIEVIVSDDASPEPFPPDVVGCRVVRSERNGGFGSAVNRGAALATRDLLLLLNSDVEIENDFLTRLLAGAAPWMPAVVSTAVWEDGQSRCIGRHWPTVLSNTLETVDVLARFHGHDWFETLIANDTTSLHATTPQLVDWAVGVCLLLPTEAFRAVGAIDERYFMNCEEIDLQRMIHERLGLPVVLLPEPVIRHEGGGSSDPARRYGWLIDARFRYHEKWGGARALAAGLTASAAINLMTNSLRAAVGRDVNARLKAKREFAAVRHGWRTRR